MIRIREGEPAQVTLCTRDARYLEHTLRGDVRIGRDQLLVRRVAGLWQLPSGEVLAVDLKKGSGADLFAWMCAVDARLMLKLGDHVREGAADGSIAEVATRAFCSVLASTLKRVGPRSQYREQRAPLAVVRGRIDWSAYAKGSDLTRVPCVHWERQLATPLNGLFAAVLRYVGGTDTLRAAAGPELPFLRDLLGHVPPLLSPDVLNLDRPLSRAESEYEPARRLAVMLLDSMGLLHGGSGTGVAFKVDLARLFERTLECAILTRSWAKPPEFQKRPPYVGDAGGWSAIDALVHREDGPMVVDAKYASAFSKGHLYQVLAYMKMVGAERGALVYPAGAEVPSRVYRGTGKERWEVRVLEVDVTRVGREPAHELVRLRALAGEGDLAVVLGDDERRGRRL